MNWIKNLITKRRNSLIKKKIVKNEDANKILNKIHKISMFNHTKKWALRVIKFYKNKVEFSFNITIELMNDTQYSDYIKLLSIKLIFYFWLTFIILFWEILK